MIKSRVRRGKEVGMRVEGLLDVRRGTLNLGGEGGGLERRGGIERL